MSEREKEVNNKDHTSNDGYDAKSNPFLIINNSFGCNIECSQYLTILIVSVISRAVVRDCQGPSCK